MASEEFEVPQFAESQLEVNQAAQELMRKWGSERYQLIKRPYSAPSIVTKRGALPRQYHSNLLANRLWKNLKAASEAKKAIYTLSVGDPVQALHASRYLNAVVVSGAGVDLVGQHYSEPAPGTGDHTYESVATMVDQIFRTQEFHDRCQREIHGVPQQLQYHDPHRYQSDYLSPIIADADSGHGSLTALMKLVRMLVERGAAGIMIDDQATGTRASVFNQGKVLVPVSESIKRLLAIRVQLDILDCDHVVIGTTSARDANLITSDIDQRDHAFILGETRPMLRLTSVLAAARENGVDDAELERIEARWLELANLKTYVEAVADHIRSNGGRSIPHLLREWYRRSRDLSIDDQMGAAYSMGIQVHWNAENARTSEGYYRYQGSIEAALSRSINYLSYSDVIMLDTEVPDILEAEHYAQGLRSIQPQVLLAYQIPNLIDWHSLPDQQVAEFQPRLSNAGFSLQYHKVAALHAQAVAAEWFSEDFSKRGLQAFIEDLQRPERYYQIYSNYRHFWAGSEYNNRVMRLSAAKEAGYSYGQLFDQQAQSFIEPNLQSSIMPAKPSYLIQNRFQPQIQNQNIPYVQRTNFPTQYSPPTSGYFKSKL